MLCQVLNEVSNRNRNTCISTVIATQPQQLTYGSKQGHQHRNTQRRNIKKNKHVIDGSKDAPAGDYKVAKSVPGRSLRILELIEPNR